MYSFMLHRIRVVLHEQREFYSKEEDKFVIIYEATRAMLAPTGPVPPNGKWIEVAYHPPGYKHCDLVVPLGALDPRLEPQYKSEREARMARRKRKASE